MPTHEYIITVSSEHLDNLHHVNNVVYVQFMQDAAASHWGRTAPVEVDAQVLWVVKSHAVEYHNAAVLGNILLMRTWTGEHAGATWDRHYEIIRPSDNKKIITAKSVWVLLDKATGRPRRVDETITKPFED